MFLCLFLTQCFKTGKFAHFIETSQFLKLRKRFRSDIVIQCSVFYNSSLIIIMYVSYHFVLFVVCLCLSLTVYIRMENFQNQYLDSHFYHCYIWNKISLIFWLLLIHFSDVIHEIKKHQGDLKLNERVKLCD